MTWTCPECGREFVTKNTWHSCVRVTEAEHLQAASPAVLATYERIKQDVLRLGGRIDPVKGYIEFTAKTRFATATIRRNWLLLNIGAEEALEHPLRNHLEGPYQGVTISRFKLQRPEDYDTVLQSFMAAAYEDFGLQKRLD